MSNKISMSKPDKRSLGLLPAPQRRKKNQAQISFHKRLIFP
jgi:hypothetical protein